MSSLSAREQRILAEIEQDLARAEPRLEQALVSARLPAFQYRPVVSADHPKVRRYLLVVAMVTSLLCGIALLVTGIVSDSFPLIFTGIPLAQLSPFAASLLSRKRSRPTR